MLVKIKKLREDAVIPEYSYDGDAGMDLTATWVEVKEDVVSYGTSLAIEIPNGFVGLVFPRSSIFKRGQILANCVAVCDSNFRGEIVCRFYSQVNDDGFCLTDVYEVGDRIAQLIILPYPKIIFEEVAELTETVRGEEGWGSSGR